MVKAIGIIGHLGSGKSTIASKLQQKGCLVFTVTDNVKNELIKKTLEKNTLFSQRSHLINITNLIRSEEGLDLLAKRIIESYSTKTDSDKFSTTTVVIEGLRSPEDVLAFKQQLNMYTIGVVASPSSIVRRLSKHSEVPSLGDLIHSERSPNKPNRHFASSCLAWADIIIDNNGTLAEFETKIEAILVHLKREGYLQNIEGRPKGKEGY